MLQTRGDPADNFYRIDSLDQTSHSLPPIDRAAAVVILISVAARELQTGASTDCTDIGYHPSRRIAGAMLLGGDHRDFDQAFDTCHRRKLLYHSSN